MKTKRREIHTTGKHYQPASIAGTARSFRCGLLLPMSHVSWSVSYACPRGTPLTPANRWTSRDAVWERADFCKPKKLYIRWEWGTLAPSDKYDGMICAAAAMRTAVAITVATWLLATCYVYVHSLLYIIWRNVFDNVIDNFSRPWQRIGWSSGLYCNLCRCSSVWVWL